MKKKKTVVNPFLSPQEYLLGNKDEVVILDYEKVPCSKLELIRNKAVKVFRYLY